MSNEHVSDLALAVLRKCHFPHLATVEGDAPRVRPVSPVWVDGFTAWVASLSSSGKTEQIRANDKVELCFMADDHAQVRIAGRAVETTDRDKRLNVWNRYELLARYFESVDDPKFVLYEIRPERVRYCKEWGLGYEEVPL